MSDLKPCPFCNGKAKLIDHRTDWFAQCQECNVIVYGETVNHLDHIEDDDEAQAAFDAVDWDALKQTAIDKWNVRAQPTITDYLEANKEMIEKTGCKVVTIASLKKFGGLDD